MTKKTKTNQIPKEFQPGTNGYHELIVALEMTLHMYETYVAEHPAADHPKLTKQVDQITDKLAKLYQTAATLDVYLDIY